MYSPTENYHVRQFSFSEVNCKRSDSWNPPKLVVALGSLTGTDFPSYSIGQETCIVFPKKGSLSCPHGALR
eukprot:3968292-Amphidinium_carterae.1